MGLEREIIYPNGEVRLAEIVARRKLGKIGPIAQINRDLSDTTHRLDEDVMSRSDPSPGRIDRLDLHRECLVGPQRKNRRNHSHPLGLREHDLIARENTEQLLTDSARPNHLHKPAPRAFGGEGDPRMIEGSRGSEH